MTHNAQADKAWAFFFRLTAESYAGYVLIFPGLRVMRYAREITDADNMSIVII